MSRKKGYLMGLGCECEKHLLFSTLEEAQNYIPGSQWVRYAYNDYWELIHEIDVDGINGGWTYIEEIDYSDGLQGKL